MGKPTKGQVNLILAAILLFSLLIRLPALFTRHIENDEVIYQVLADKVANNPSDYSIRGTPLVDQLPRSIYDQPLFHHPPLFAYLLGLIKNIFGARWEILIPILAAVFTSLVVFLIGKELYGEGVGLLSSFFFSICPVALHASTKIWMDTLLGLFCVLSVYFAIKALKKEVIIWYILSGVSLGLAMLTKCTALCIIPALLYILFKDGFSKKKIKDFSILGIAALFITAPWFILFYKTFHTFLPWWARQNEESMRMFPFLKMAIGRPVYFYFTNTVIIAPIYLFGFIEMIRRLKTRGRLIETIWVLSFISGLTIIGATGGLGYITRYILPALPGLALLSAGFLENRNKYFWILACSFCAYSLFLGIINAYFFQVADVYGYSYFFSGPK
ncbi:MAG: glycosyltransferase family 39 protein [Candidatus Omnitrophica bacterium]|nr:glycosyltransferase family 39 protein [Candidatus Omnitrophota bacterium]